MLAEAFLYVQLEHEVSFGQFIIGSVLKALDASNASNEGVNNIWVDFFCL